MTGGACSAAVSAWLVLPAGARINGQQVTDASLMLAFGAMIEPETHATLVITVDGEQTSFDVTIKAYYRQDIRYERS